EAVFGGRGAVAVGARRDRGGLSAQPFGGPGGAGRLPACAPPAGQGRAAGGASGARTVAAGARGAARGRLAPARAARVPALGARSDRDRAGGPEAGRVRSESASGQ